MIWKLVSQLTCYWLKMVGKALIGDELVVRDKNISRKVSETDLKLNTASTTTIDF